MFSGVWTYNNIIRSSCLHIKDETNEGGSSFKVRELKTTVCRVFLEKISQNTLRTDIRHSKSYIYTI